MSNHQPSQHVTVTNRTIIRIILWVIVSFAAVKFIDSIMHPLTLIFISFFLAIALNPAVSKISKMFKNRNRALATGIAYIIVITILIGFLAIVIPPIVKQGVSYVKTVPETLESIHDQQTSLGRFVRRYNLEEQFANAGEDFKNKFSNIQEPALSTATRVGSTIASVITVIILTFMMLVEGPRWLKKFWQLQPKDKVNERKEIAHKMYKVITGYVNGQLLIAIIAGLFAFIALSIASNILNVTINAVALAGLVTLFALVPMVGGIIGSSLVILSSLFVSTPLAIIMLIYFVVYYQLENAWVQPYIQSRNNTLTPLLVFMAALIGVYFAGLLGGLVAIPVAGCIKVIIDDRLERHIVLRED